HGIHRGDQTPGAGLPVGLPGLINHPVHRQPVGRYYEVVLLLRATHNPLHHYRIVWVSLGPAGSSRPTASAHETETIRQSRSFPMPSLVGPPLACDPAPHPAPTGA